jgi:L-histidine N-alpha-methyltransferase
MAPLLTVDVHFAPSDRRRALEEDVRTGLTARPKALSPVWFYDDVGSRLFDEITRLPEYYLTRAERSILTARADEIVARAGADTLVELGSGTSEKTRLLLDAMAAAGSLRRFVPFDVSEETLRSAAAAVGAAYGVEVRAVVGDFSRHLVEVPREGARLIAFLGSTIGNLVPHERHRFLAELRATMAPEDRLLLGTDLVKDRRRLLAAYDDASGVTAAFNRNVLAVVNAELGGHFDPGAFDHVVRWDEGARWIEMRLRATRPQDVSVDDLGRTFRFAGGEEVRTEISAKFTDAQLDRELAGARLMVDRRWTDAAGDFLLTLVRPRR